MSTGAACVTLLGVGSERRRVQMTSPKYLQIQLSRQAQFTGPGLQDCSHPREMRTTLCCRVRHARTAATPRPGLSQQARDVDVLDISGHISLIL